MKSFRQHLIQKTKDDIKKIKGYPDVIIREEYFRDEIYFHVPSKRIGFYTVVYTKHNYENKHEEKWIKEEYNTGMVMYDYIRDGKKDVQTRI